MTPLLAESELVQNGLYLFLALVLVVVNGFFVAAEFALVKIRGSRLELLAESTSFSARVGYWLGKRLDGSLSACQLGITMASLALGWVGEPAFADLIHPLFQLVGITSEQAIHTTAFAFAFTMITSLHLIIGEQAPKIYAIRQPERMLLWCSIPLAGFYFLSYPLLVALSYTTSFLLKRLGVSGSDSHDEPHTAEELRALVTQAHAHGELTRSEHSLLNAVFEFDDIICRRVMVPRHDVVYLTVDQSIADAAAVIQASQHTRYPVCRGSLDDVVGVLHIKDLIGKPADESLETVARRPFHVPEAMPISQLLRHFQATHQLMALVDDEHGTVVGVVTLENVLEQIVGAVEDEFDREESPIVRETEGTYVVEGHALLSTLHAELNLNWDTPEVDTLSGYLTAQARRSLRVGDRFELTGAAAEVLELEGTRAKRVRITLQQPRLPADAD